MNKKIKAIVFSLCLLITVSAVCSAKEGVAVSKDGTRISFSIYGKGEPVLIFVHGWCCDRSFWKKQIPYFKKKYHVIAVDLAGHGRSGHERTVYSMKDFGEDIAAVVRRIGADKVILIGHSMGGPVIVEASQIIPDNVIGLVGIDTLRNFETVYTQEQIDDYTNPLKEDFKKNAGAFIRTMFVKGTNPKFADKIVKKMTRESPEIALSAMEEMLKLSYVNNPLNIKVPVRCLNSDLWPTNSEVNRKYAPDFDVRIMPGTGHFLMLEKPAEFNKQLDDIIQDILKK